MKLKDIDVDGEELIKEILNVMDLFNEKNDTWFNKKFPQLYKIYLRLKINA